MMKLKQPDGSFVYEGYAIDLLKEIAKRHKFTYEIYEVPDGMYGAEINGTWNGVVKELLDGVRLSNFLLSFLHSMFQVYPFRVYLLKLLGFNPAAC